MVNIKTRNNVKYTMDIKELIKLLKQVEKEEGNIPVIVDIRNAGWQGRDEKRYLLLDHDYMSLVVNMDGGNVLMLSGVRTDL